MSTPSSNPDRRLCRRRQARGRIRVSCQKGSLDLGPNLAIALEEISESGMRLVVKCALEKGQEVCLRLEGQGHLKPVKRTGKVMWCVPAEDGKFQVGIHFATRIDYGDIFKLT